MSNERMICDKSGFGESSSSSSTICSGLELFKRVGVSFSSSMSSRVSFSLEFPLLLLRAKALHFLLSSGIRLSCLEPGIKVKV